MSLYLEMEPLRRWLRLIEVIRVDSGSNRSGVLINEKGAADLSLSLSLSAMWGHNKKVTAYKPERELLPGAKPGWDLRLSSL